MKTTDTMPLRALGATLLSLLVAACSTDLSTDLGGRACGPAGACLPGYQCDLATSTCVSAGTVPVADASSEAETAEAASEDALPEAPADHELSDAPGDTGDSDASDDVDAKPVDADVENDALPDVTVDASPDVTVDASPDGGAETGTDSGGEDGSGDGGEGGAIDAAPMCEAGLAECSGQCVDMSTDPSHCGACGNVCEAPLSGDQSGTATCIAGVCGIACADSLQDCATVQGRRACVSTTDPQFCGGSCGTQCDKARDCGGTGCTADTCSPGTTSCGVLTGCVNLLTDHGNCGKCGTSCSYNYVCQQGVCMNATCSGATPTSCGTSGFKGCTDLKRDWENCGSCGSKCGKSQVCSDSVCVDYVHASAEWECTHEVHPGFGGAWCELTQPTNPPKTQRVCLPTGRTTCPLTQ